jgi:WD40 repeat protein
VAELDSNHTEPLLPGIPIAVPEGPASVIPGYDISPDGSQLAFFSPDRDGKARLWLTPFDRRSPPRQVPNVVGEHPLFGPSDEIFFRMVEGTSAFLYSVRKDGTVLRKTGEQVVISLFSASSDRKWILLGVPSIGEVLFPTGGGAPISLHLHYPDWLRWSGDGKHLFVCGTNENRAKAYVVPLSPGQVLPSSITLARNFLSDQDLAKLPGVRTIPAGDVVPGPTADIYAFTRETVQRNLYRIPLQ